jgi:hypothetical protein
LRSRFFSWTERTFIPTLQYDPASLTPEHLAVRVAHRPRIFAEFSVDARFQSKVERRARHEHAAKPSKLRPFDPLERLIF